MGRIGHLPRRAGIAVRIAAFVLVFALLVSFLTWLVFPPVSRTSRVLNTMRAMKEAPDTILLGTSVTYRSFMPLYAQELTGDTFLDLSTQAQTFIAAYNLLKQAVREGKKPGTAFLLVTIQRFTVYSNNSYKVQVFENLPWSFDKVQYLFDGFELSEWPDALLKPYRARERFTWNQVRSKFSSLFKQSEIVESTTDALDDAAVSESSIPEQYRKYCDENYVYCDLVQNPESIDVGAYYRFSESSIVPVNMKYFNAIVDLCKQEGIDLVLISRPRLPQNLMGSGTYGQFHDWIQSLADEKGLSFWDLTYLHEDILTVEDTNFRDGYHGNTSLAFPLTEILAGMYNEYKAGTLNLSDWTYDSYDHYLSIYGDRVALKFGNLTTAEDGHSLISVTLITGDPDSYVGQVRLLARRNSKKDWDEVRDWTDITDGRRSFSLKRLENRGGGTWQLRVELRNADGEFVQYLETSVTLP